MTIRTCRRHLPGRAGRPTVQTLAWWTRPLPVLRALPRPLRIALHDRAARHAAVRAHHRPGRDPRGVHRAARGPAPRRGRAHPRAGRRPELGHPARRGAAPRAAPAAAPRVPRRAHAAPHRAWSPRSPSARSPRGRATRPFALHAPAPGADARDHPARGLRPRPRPAPGPPARAAHPRSSRSARARSACVPALQRDLGPGARAGRFSALQGEHRRRASRELVDERRAGGEERDDILAMLLVARARGRLADELRGDPRRAHDRARRRPRDDRLAARVDVRARSPASPASCASSSRELDAGDDDAYLDGDDQRVAAPPARAARTPSRA